MSNPLRVLVVDDMALYRKLLTDLINEIPGAEVVGAVPNGKEALERIYQDRPDVITLDIEMPVMDGLEVLRELKTWKSSPKAIVVSAHTREGAVKTMMALDAGADEFITKPDGHDAEENREQLAVKLRSILTGLIAGSRSRAAPEIVAIAVSTGGPKALNELIPRLPADLPVPVTVVLHIPIEFTAALVNTLDRKSALSVTIGEDDMALEPGTVYFAPGGKQMRIESACGKSNPVLRVTDDPPENFCRPSADYLMRSVAQVYGERSLGVIMTGMGDDGVRGLRMMKEVGAAVIAQDEESCVVFGMPLEAVKAGIVDILAPLKTIPDLIGEKVTKAELARERVTN